MFMPKIRPAEMIPSAPQLNKIAAETDVALLTIGRTSGEFMDRKITGDFDLTEAEQALIQGVCNAYHAAGKKVVVILNIGGVIETASWKDLPDAILLAWQAGQEGGNSVADILKGAVNPSGKLPMTFPVNYMDVASSANFPYDYQFDMRKAFGSFMNPDKEEQKELVRNVDYTLYEEDIFVGYRFFDTFGKAVSYPFGYGLSYTNFAYTDAQIAEKNGTFTITVNISNTGNVAGKEVVQLYVAAPENAQLPKPLKELKAFAKTKDLQPGEKQAITLKVKVADMASYDDKAGAWVTDSGDYQFILGSSSADVKAQLNGKVASKTFTKTHNVLNPQEPLTSLTGVINRVK
jgi:beta-glucosidase